MSDSLKVINDRYSGLAEDTCCLSCGDAIGLSEAKPGQVCVDLGSGRGTDVMKMADLVGAEGHAYGIDISDGMLAKARRTAKKLGYENVTFLQSPLEQLPLKDDSVDLIISNCTLNHAGDKQKVWDEIFRILKPCGTFYVSDIYATEEVAPEYANDPASIAACWGGAITRERYMDTLQQAGFDDVKILEETEPYPKGAIECVSITLSGSVPCRCNA